MAPSKAPIACSEHQRLLREFMQSVSHYHRMQSAQLAAVRKGEDFPFEYEIAEAARRRELAKYAVLAHREQHGC